MKKNEKKQNFIQINFSYTLIGSFQISAVIVGRI